MVNSLEVQQNLQKFMLLGTFFLGAIFFGLLLAGAPVLLVLCLGLVGWLVLLPYHAQLAAMISIVTFAAAIIVPGVPGRPFAWEAAAMLGWTGVAVTLALRQSDPDSPLLVRRNWVLFAGAIGYSIVLLVLIYTRGAGIRVFGGSQIGGRIYFQQLACAVFPLLFALRPLSEKLLVKLFVWQCLLSATFLVADFTFSFGHELLMPLLYFLELPNDGINFESQSLGLGIRRFQSLFFFSLAMLSLLWSWRPFSDYFTKHGFWMWPLTIALLGIGLLGGHRYLMFLVVFIVFISGWAQRFFTPLRVLGIVLVGGLVLGAATANIRSLPLAAQRALSIIPGLDVDRQAAEDGQSTLDGRKAVRKAGLETARSYLWLGRGFGKPPSIDFRAYHDLTYVFVDMGIFYNGTVGLLVNTGIPGTFAMFLFLGAGTVIVIRVLRHVRALGAGTFHARMSCVLAATWIGQLVSFVFFHGDSEFAMRTFAMQAGVLLMCDYHLLKRRRTLAAASGVAAAPAVEAAPEAVVPTAQPA